MTSDRCMVCSGTPDIEMVIVEQTDRGPIADIEFLCPDSECYGDAHLLVDVRYLTVLGDPDTPTMLAEVRAELNGA